MLMFRGSELVNVAVKLIQMDGVVNTEAIIATPCLHRTIFAALTIKQRHSYGDSS